MSQTPVCCDPRTRLISMLCSSTILPLLVVSLWFGTPISITRFLFSQKSTPWSIPHLLLGVLPHSYCSPCLDKLISLFIYTKSVLYSSYCSFSKTGALVLNQSWDAAKQPAIWCDSNYNHGDSACSSRTIAPSIHLLPHLLGLIPYCLGHPWVP